MLELVTIVAIAGPPAGDARRCLSCHPANVAGHLYDWDRSVHARTGVTCRTCHPAERDPFAHESIHDPGARATAILVSCNACHPHVAATFAASRHHSGAQADKPTCATCHSTAGGSVLRDQMLANRCGECHEPATSERALGLLHVLRQATLARTLVHDGIERRRKQGLGVRKFENTLAAIDRVYAGITLEWHRFDFDTAEKHSTNALRALEMLYERLGEGG